MSFNEIKVISKGKTKQQKQAKNKKVDVQPFDPLQPSQYCIVSNINIKIGL